MTAYHNITVELKQHSIEDKTPIYIQNGILAAFGWHNQKGFHATKMQFYCFATSLRNTKKYMPAYIVKSFFVVALKEWK